MALKLLYDYIAAFFFVFFLKSALDRFFPQVEIGIIWVILLFLAATYPIYLVRRSQYKAAEANDARLLGTAKLLETPFAWLARLLALLLVVALLIFIGTALYGLLADWTTADYWLQQQIILPLLDSGSLLRLLIDVYGLRPKWLLIILMLVLSGGRLVGIYLVGQAYKK